MASDQETTLEKIAVLQVFEQNCCDEPKVFCTTL